MVPSIQRKGIASAKARFLVLWYFFFSLLIVMSFKMRFESTKVNLDLKGKKESRSDVCGKQAKKHENSCFPDSCARDEYTVWEDWKACTQHTLKFQKWSADRTKVMAMVANATMMSSLRTESANFTAFEEFIIENRDKFPWSLNSNFTAVMLEFRPRQRQLTFSVNNAMNNLPVNWRVQILGGPSILDMMKDLFPAEITAGKIVLTDLGRDQGNKVTK
jgi:hypothetical protein